MGWRLGRRLEAQGAWTWAQTSSLPCPIIESSALGVEAQSSLFEAVFDSTLHLSTCPGSVLPL